MDAGWVKLYRKFRDNPIYKNSKAVHIWLECLLRAHHSDTEFYLARQKINLSSGQFPMGREEFGQSVGISASTVWWWLEQFEKEKMINIKRTTKGSIITINNWSEYQKVDNKKTTNKQQMNINKNDKNVKNEKNIYDQNFLKFYEAYPIKIGKKKAYDSFKKVSVDLDVLIGAINNQQKSRASMKKAGKFVPEWKHPATWLNQECWEDVLDTPAINKPKEKKEYVEVTKTDQYGREFSMMQLKDNQEKLVEMKRDKFSLKTF